MTTDDPEVVRFQSPSVEGSEGGGSGNGSVGHEGEEGLRWWWEDERVVGAQ